MSHCVMRTPFAARSSGTQSVRGPGGTTSPPAWTGGWRGKPASRTATPGSEREVAALGDPLARLLDLRRVEERREALREGGDLVVGEAPDLRDLADGGARG